MKIGQHSVIYFINEEYGAVMKVCGATGEAALWDARRHLFSSRIDLVTASFLARTDRYEGKWCAAHPTYSARTAVKAAMNMTACLPSADGQRLARAAKLQQMRARLHEVGGARLAQEIEETWKIREAAYAGL